MTKDLEDLNKISQIKKCETCMCLTCQSGKMFNKAPCPKGKNCSICKEKDPVNTCEHYKSGF